MISKTGKAFHNFATRIVGLALVLPLQCFSLGLPAMGFEAKLPAAKEISVEKLNSYPKKSVEVKEEGKLVKYEGVAVRTLLKEFLPGTDLDKMPNLKEINRRKLMMEVEANDKYPGIVTAVEVAMNADGERFILATKKDGEPLKGVKMICKLDEHKTRWVHDIVVLRLSETAASSTSK